MGPPRQLFDLNPDDIYTHRGLFDVRVRPPQGNLFVPVCTCIVLGSHMVFGFKRKLSGFVVAYRWNINIPTLSPLC